MYVVLDASVVVKWYLAHSDEQDAKQALAILNGMESGSLTPIQPPHFLAELAAVLARKLPEFAPSYFQELSRIFGDKVAEPDGAVYQRAIGLSTQLDHHLFDTLYHALALEGNATLITADYRYYEKAKGYGNIMRLQDFALS